MSANERRDGNVGGEREAWGLTNMVGYDEPIRRGEIVGVHFVWVSALVYPAGRSLDCVLAAERDVANEDMAHGCVS